MKTLMVQFVKGAWKSGEVEAARLLSPYLEVRPMGEGFVRTTRGKPPRSDIAAANKALEFARQASQSGAYDILILDEVNVAIDLGLLKPESVLALLDEKPPELTLVLTGEPAHPAILQKADLVTRMEEVKHPFQKNIKAKMGIDY
jgi:cob(I)alamin adenosyltransferase